ncbi:type IV pilus assembly protein PilM [Candidatus Saccharibacteria bacterium]|jgi:type IV pilus assembly protein pilM|nr:type IV pilus assembly protein PilM [Candidatus Saccharibacteria bacterium]MBF1037499.1 type IV pilus assembly protein PilM [Candidatus Nanosynbacter sp.]MBB1531401.1 type IV pilus assembly protein PilM [Candidatus Saccharibacteria bacterium]MBB1531826.1 type IV pilus assembly protein PilM [Candidatus Saccharibacteria bacterium]MBB1549343.1 type IV pilus assembly protein PilM [Candidatus Saccharibacteria bacterium]
MSLLHGVGDFFALDIGTNSIRMIQLSGNAEKGWTLDKFAYVPVDQKITKDDSETGKRKLGEIILGAREQAGIKTKNIAIGLPARKTYTAIIEVPNAPQRELTQTVKYEADQYVPMSVDEAKIDFAVLGISPNDAKKAEILLSSTDNAYAESVMESVEQLGLNVIAQEPEPIAMVRALAPVGVQDARMIIDLGETSTDLVVMYQGSPRLVRSIPGGLLSFVRTVENSLKVRDDQARQFILKFGLAQDKLEGKVFEALKSTLEGFAMEMTKSVRFFQNRYVGAQVGGIVLSGFSGIIPFMAEYIEMQTGVATTQGNPWQYVKVTPAQQQMLLPVASEFAVAIGLAERSNE